MTIEAPNIKLPVDPSLISLDYRHEHALRAYEFTVTARIDAAVPVEDLAAYEALTSNLGSPQKPLLTGGWRDR